MIHKMRDELPDVPCGTFKLKKDLEGCEDRFYQIFCDPDDDDIFHYKTDRINTENGMSVFLLKEGKVSYKHSKMQYFVTMNDAHASYVMEHLVRIKLNNATDKFLTEE